MPEGIFAGLSLPKKVFWAIFGFGLAMGLFMGLLNLVFPDAGQVSLNGENVEGITALFTAVMASAIPFFVIALIGAGITSLFTRNKKSS